MRESTSVNDRAVARAIAAALFTDGWGKQVETLALTDSDGQYRGGWCKSAVEEMIYQALLSAARERA